MPNLYADVGDFRRYAFRNAALDTEDTTLALALLEASSRAIDSATRRAFYAETVTRYINGRGGISLEFPGDFASVSALNVDEGDDRVFELTLVEDTDYELAQLDAEYDDSGPPWTGARLLVDGQISAWPSSRRSIELTGRQGYSDIVAAVLTSAGVAVTGTLDNAADLTLATSAVASPEITPGGTYRIGSEDIYIVSGSASPFTVKRGVNGTTAAAHSAVALNKYVYEADIVGATLLQVGRLWKRKDVPILPVVAGPGIGSIMLAEALDPDVQAMIARLKRYRA